MPVEKEARLLSRRHLRYRLYRIKSGDPLADDGLKSYFESQDEFDGWHNFGITWDVQEQEGEWPEGHFIAASISEPLEAQWQRTLLGLAQDPPGHESEDDS